MLNLSSLVKLRLLAPEQTAQHLSFTYKASNIAEKDVYVFNILPPAKKGPSPGIDPERAYTQIDGTMLVVSKRLIEVPKGVRALAPEVPFLTQLSPGEELVEKVTLNIPIHEDFPYRKREPESQPERRHLCKSLIFLLGFIMPPEPRWVRRATINGRELWATDYGFAIQKNLVASSESVPIAVECVQN